MSSSAPNPNSTPMRFEIDHRTRYSYSGPIRLGHHRVRLHPSDSGYQRLIAHELVIDPGRHEVLVRGKAVELTVTEFKILHMLARRPGLVFTRYQIVDALHGGDYVVTERAVDVQMVALRKKLGSCGEYIETVRGVGYRFKD